MPVRDALAEIKRNAGTQFDPRVVDAFCDLALRDPQLLAS
jgi:HD-GYP domain-containing protein (c-di-GMP phosphodiesterase class II)